MKRTVKQPSGCAQSPLSSAFPIIIFLGNFLCSAPVVLLDRHSAKDIDLLLPEWGSGERHTRKSLKAPSLRFAVSSSTLVLLQVLWGDIGLARNMCKFQPHKPGPTQTPCAPPVRELWVACSATQELPTRPSYAPKTLEQKRKSVGTKKAVLEVLGQKKFTLDTQVTHWHTASKRCQPAWLQTYRDWRIDRWIGGR